jgi:hypothetical protein
MKSESFSLRIKEPPQRYVPDLNRAMNELNLNIDFNLSQSLDKTIRWQRTEGG